MASMLPSLRAHSTRVARPAAARSFASSSRSSQDAQPQASSSSTEAVAADPTAADTGALDAAAAAATPATSSTKKGYRAWLNGEGARFRKALQGRTNWIADTPFPLNPTFNPLPPLADSVKTKIYNAYLHNILLKDATDSQVVRAVSTRFGVSMDRVRAIIRLKELEKRWKEDGRALQTELLKGMESHLGVKQVSDNWRGVESPDPAKPQLASSKTVFEMVDVESGDSPVFLPLLSRVPLRSTPLTTPPASSTTTAATTSTDKNKSLLVPASRAGRASILFSDLSGTSQGKKLEESYDRSKTKRGKPAAAKRPAAARA
ncbi:eukaryotic mitochondrial regulator protein-domain-containing protein [Rhodotorula diobovata]|uniref:Eukaryotic mitochondrial regulator protein-domain-containing protein n=1 Tax=Rhodotorula diobovata TaxID=5288 RepID=A0A5C5FRG0_9BASI|nr:eukaryotic mitochondrial regulator protein-domain-containing protein [Rhodotorula diobovata]